MLSNRKMTSVSPTHSDGSASSSKHDNHQDSWEIIEGLKGNPGNIQEPEKQEGFLLKRRKWPMKGWQKVNLKCLSLSPPNALEGKIRGYFQIFSSYGREDSRKDT